MVKKHSVSVVMWGAILFGLGTSATAAETAKSCHEVASISAKLKAGASYYSHLEFSPNDASLGLGMDVGFNPTSGLGISAGVRILQESRVTRNNITTSIDSRYFGIAPGYTVKKDSARLSGSLGLGVMTSTIERMENLTTVLTNSTRMALAPGLELDVMIGGGASLNLSLQYLVTLGSAPNPWVFLPMAGIGWTF
jgi:hypothetical protein